jgi:hypothetical protein
MQARAGRVTKVGKVKKNLKRKRKKTKGFFMAQKKVFIFFLRNGLSYKHYFIVIISTKP